MDYHAIREAIDSVDYKLFALGKTQITVFTLVKLAISALLLYLVAGRLSRWTLRRLLGRTKMEQGQQLAIIALVHYGVLVFGAMLILQNAGINLTAFAMVGSALGVGVGFGLQNIISNFISGLIVLLERPIEIGDRIELAGVEGVVREIGARRTTIITPDHIAILVPNQKFITDNVTNYLYFDRSVRLRVPLAIGPGQDIRHVESVLLAAASHADVHADPKPEVVITGMSASAVSLELWVWYDGQSFARVDVANRVYHAAFDALAAAGIKMGS
ncbi:MAG TPA: mechanosensitive ion channel domain-containing protein [Burkholderiaceae bacterium]